MDFQEIISGLIQYYYTYICFLFLHTWFTSKWCHFKSHSHISHYYIVPHFISLLLQGELSKTTFLILLSDEAGFQSYIFNYRNLHIYDDYCCTIKSKSKHCIIYRCWNQEGIFAAWILIKNNSLSKRTHRALNTRQWKFYSVNWDWSLDNVKWVGFFSGFVPDEVTTFWIISIHPFSFPLCPVAMKWMRAVCVWSISILPQ